ncbi:MAG: site-specific integrase [Atopobiaceae bacterium]|nr:site-specific integrase [Atopobiaceae bacterium]
MSVYRDEGRGTWYVQASYHDSHGRRHRTTKRGFATRREAQAWERDFVALHEGSLTMTLASFWEVYAEDRRPRVRESTWLTKEAIVTDKILPFFGDMPVCEIGPADVIAWQNELSSRRDASGAPYSPTYLRTVETQLSAILNHAVRYYGLPRNPVLAAGHIGRKNSEEMSFWTKDEYLRFSEAIMDKPDAWLAFEVLYWTGLREGEMLALTPSDIDFARNRISVTKTYQRLHREDVVGPPKTERSRRVVDIPRFLAEELRDHIAQEGVCKGERIFRMDKGYLYREMRRGAALAGVKRIRVHDLRHSHVSLLIEKGFNVLAIAQRMGHESIDITYRYAHLLPSGQADMAAALDEEGGAR